MPRIDGRYMAVAGLGERIVTDSDVSERAARERAAAAFMPTRGAKFVEVLTSCLANQIG